MKPAPFDYVRAESVEDALDVLAETGGDARILAGGQSLLPMLNMRLARPHVAIDVMRVPALKKVAEKGGALTVHAGVRQVEIERRPNMAKDQPLLDAALVFVGHAQTRSRGTLCGSIAHADPSAELPLVLVALGGTVHLRSRRARRMIAAEAFFTGLMATERRDDEMIEAITFPPKQTATGYAFREVARRHGDFAIVACAASADAKGARLAIGGVAERPTARAMPLPGSSALDDALNEFAWSLEARDDLHASARYRRELVRRIGKATVEEAARCRA
ncbi:MAG: FAD binding domain-containing protein [Methylobacteriaceae bacterium]|nr:FAD binding domain-containing protein [Methylobacteriaceae bacterium]